LYLAVGEFCEVVDVYAYRIVDMFEEAMIDLGTGVGACATFRWFPEKDALSEICEMGVFYCCAFGPGCRFSGSIAVEQFECAQRTSTKDRDLISTIICKSPSELRRYN